MMPPARSSVLVPSAALLWGLQAAFLTPVLALLLVSLYDATTVQVGWVIAVYNASGFLAALVIPARADRARRYLPSLLVCAALTAALAAALALSTSLPIAAVALAVLGGPASSGFSLLFAHLRQSGATPNQVVNTRAVVSFAWVAGPPIATFLVGAFGDRSLLAALGVIGMLSVAVTALMMRGAASDRLRRPVVEQQTTMRPSRSTVAVVIGAFVAVQAGNAAAVAVMTLYVTESLGLGVVWAGAALAVAAGLEIPALLIMGRLSRRFTSLGLIIAGCLAGIAYCAAMAVLSGPIALLAVQVLSAWLVAAVAGIGMTLFQDMIPQPGLAVGIYANTRRIGAIASGAIIAFGSTSALGYRGVFVASGLVTALALLMLLVVRIRPSRSGHH